MEQTHALVDPYIAGWKSNGLDVWVARDKGTGALVGIGGPSLRGGLAWNLYYRLAPTAWGRGYAQEIIAATRTALAAMGSISRSSPTCSRTMRVRAEPPSAPA